MALYKVSLRKAVNDAGGAWKWSNTYHVEAATPTAAAALGVELWTEGERVFHRQRVFCYEVYASSVLVGDTAYVIEPVPNGDQQGAISGAGDQLPNFNVVRVDLPTVAGGRPSRKFYRPTLEEGDQTNGVITNATLLAAINTGLTWIIDHPDVGDESGVSWAGHTVRGITSRRVGKWAYTAVPSPPV